MTTATRERTEFVVDLTERSKGYNAPQKVGRRLWAPMLLLAVMAWPVGLVLSWARAAIIADFGVTDVGALRLSHLVPAFMFLGFFGVLSAVSFAIARILGALRKGGGDVQETIGRGVETLTMPRTARVFMLAMMMGMMTIGIAILLHFVAAANVATWTAASIERWAIVLEGFRRFGVALYLFGIAFGLGTIIHVLRFQATRIRELAGIA